MADEIFILQYVFYVLILLILAAVLRGWWGLACGVLAGFLIIWVIFMLINSDLHSYDTRGR